MSRKKLLLIAVLALMAFYAIVGIVQAGDPLRANFRWLICRKLTVKNSAKYLGDIDMDGNNIAEVSDVQCDTVTEYTSGSGVTADSVLLKDGGITLKNAETILNGDNGVIDVSSAQVTYKRRIVDKAAAYTCLVTESGTIFTNNGATGNITFTLPAAAAGLEYTFVVSPAQTLAVDPSGTNHILEETNTAGDYISCTTQWARISLVATDNNTWLPTMRNGTWGEE